jgi:glycerophosphoryl diester phosphodiesterase
MGEIISIFEFKSKLLYARLLLHVGKLTFEKIRELDAGSWFSKGFAGEPILTLDEVLDELRVKIGILIEIKSPILYPGIELEVANKLIEPNMHRPENEKIIFGEIIGEIENENDMETVS